MYLDNESFYTEYLTDKNLTARVEFLDNYINHTNDAISLGVFSMVEGGILYSSFGFLRHFQSEGKNKLLNINRGILFSVKDENLHSLAGAVAFKKKLEEYSAEEQQNIKKEIYSAAATLYEHEEYICDLIFAKGEIAGITAHQLKCFAKSRVNICLQQLGYEKLFDVTYNPIAEWFYKGINNYSYNDFFSGMSSQYHRDWNEEDFEWKTE